MRNVWIIVAVAVVAGGIGYLGGQSGRRTRRTIVDENGEERRALEAEVADLRERLGIADGGRRIATESSDPVTRVTEPEPDTVALPDAPPPEVTEEPSPVAVTAFSLEGLSSASDLSKRLMDFAEDQLGRGDEGYLALMNALDTLANDKTLMRTFGEEQMVREIYPWIKFLTQHETEMVGMSDWVFKTLAEKPATFGEMDNDIVEIFTEGIGAMLPGAVPPEHIEILRGYAEKFLAIPESELPEQVRRARGDVERLLTRYWATPQSQAERLAALKAGTLSPDAALELIAQLDSSALSGVDVTAVLEIGVGDGNWQVNQIIRRHRGLLDQARLDRALSDALDRGKPIHGFFIRQYFEATGRKTWPEIQAFFDTALASRNEKGRHTAATALTTLPEAMRPPAVYVSDAIARYDFGPLEETLKARFGLK